MSNVTLTVGGMDYGGWESVSVSRAIDQMSGGFALTLTDRWTDGAAPWPILPGLAAEILLDGTRVISGYIDTVAPSFDSDSRTLSVSGRDKVADMIDCSHSASFEYGPLTLGKMAATLAAPFNVSVIDNSGSSDPVRGFSIQPGETPQEIIDRYARQIGVLVSSDAAGNLVLFKPSNSGRAAVALVQGQNILAASGQLSHADRFYKLKVLGQSWGSDNESPSYSAQVLAEAVDAAVRATRIAIVVSQNSITPADAQAKAKYEQGIRAAKSTELTIVVQGWRQKEGGELWRPDLLVSLTAPWLQIFKPTDFLIRAVEYKMDNGGELCQLSLVRPDAYQQDPELTKAADPWAVQGEEGGADE